MKTTGQWRIPGGCDGSGMLMEGLRGMCSCCESWSIDTTLSMSIFMQPMLKREREMEKGKEREAIMLDGEDYHHFRGEAISADAVKKNERDGTE